MIQKYTFANVASLFIQSSFAVSSFMLLLCFAVPWLLCHDLRCFFYLLLQGDCVDCESKADDIPLRPRIPAGSTGCCRNCLLLQQMMEYVTSLKGDFVLRFPFKLKSVLTQPICQKKWKFLACNVLDWNTLGILFCLCCNLAVVLWLQTSTLKRFLIQFNMDFVVFFFFNECLFWQTGEF